MVLRWVQFGPSAPLISPRSLHCHLRVSTADQHPETQLYDLREMAKQRGYEIVREYSDTISGAKSKGPGLDQLMADATRHRVRELPREH